LNSVGLSQLFAGKQEDVLVAGADLQPGKRSSGKASSSASRLWPISTPAVHPCSGVWGYTQDSAHMLQTILAAGQRANRFAPVFLWQGCIEGALT